MPLRIRQLALALLMLSLVGCGSTRSSAAGSAATETSATAVRRPFVQTLRLSGLVAASRSYVVAAPRMAGAGGMSSIVVTRLVRPGTVVKQGDLLVEFDRQAQIKNANDRRAEYLDFEAQIRKKQADQQAALASDESDLKQAENAVEKARLERLKNEFASAIEAEKNDQRFEEAEAKLKQLRQTFGLKRRAAEAELRILEIQRDRAKAAMLNAESNAKKLTIVSPIGGLVVPKQIWKGSGQMGPVQEGEEVRAGAPIVEVIDATSMEVRAKVNQADFAFLQVGQGSAIGLDADPGMTLGGRLTQLGPIASEGDASPKVRTFTAIFAIEGSDAALMPDLSASIDVEVGRVAGAVVVPRDALRYRDGRAFVMVRRGSGYAERAVTVRARSDSEVAIASGLQPGEVVRRGV